jgi:hypothetical protein
VPSKHERMRTAAVAGTSSLLLRRARSAGNRLAGGGFAAIVEEMGDLTQEKFYPTPPPGPPYAATGERVAAVASEHGIEILSPPSEH